MKRIAIVLAVACAHVPDHDPVVIREVKRPYPVAARRSQKEGTVRLRVSVAANGTVSNVSVLTPVDPDLDDAAVRAMKEFRFDPAIENGVAVERSITYNYMFALGDSDGAPAPPPPPPASQP